LTLEGFKWSSPPRRKGFKGILFLGFLLTLFSTPFAWAVSPKTLSDQQKEVEAAARNYLEAEVARDFTRVYGSLYPGSDYCKANNFQAYRAEAQSSPVRITAYEILRIVLLEENPDKKKFPNLEEFARVEVDLVLHYSDTNQKADVNYNFPFVKEGGKWYKL